MLGNRRPYTDDRIKARLRHTGSFNASLMSLFRYRHGRKQGFQSSFFFFFNSLTVRLRPTLALITFTTSLFIERCILFYQPLISFPTVACGCLPSICSVKISLHTFSTFALRTRPENSNRLQRTYVGYCEISIQEIQFLVMSLFEHIPGCYSYIYIYIGPNMILRIFF